MNKTFYLLFSILLTFIFFGSSLNNEYSIDDTVAFTNNLNANSGLENLQNIFRENTFKEGEFSFGYRPITTLAFALESHFFGVNPFISHFISLLLYSLLCFVFVLFYASLFPNTSPKQLLLACFLFTILPIHSELVNNIKCRDELLMNLFGLLAMLSWINRQKSLLFYFSTILLILLSILSKKTGIIYLAVIPLISFFDPKFSIKKFSLSIFTASIPALLFILIRKFSKVESSVREIRIIENPLHSEVLDVNSLVLASESFIFYLTKLILPLNLVSYYGFDTIPYEKFSMNTFLAIVFVISLTLLAFYNIQKRRPYSFGILLFLGGILPFLNIILPVVGIVAERFASIASIGFVIAIIDGSNYLVNYEWGSKFRKASVYLILAYGVFFYSFHQKRNREWKNNFTTVLADVDKEPKSASLHSMVGVEYMNRIPIAPNNREKISLGKKAKYHFTESLNIIPNKIVLTNLASIEFRAFLNYKRSEELYRELIKIDPNYFSNYYHLGWLYFAKNDSSKAIKYFEKAIVKNPKYLDSFEPLVKYLVNHKEFSKAHQIVNKGLNALPKDGSLVLLKANIYFFERNYKKALDWFEKGLLYYPSNQNIIQKIDFINSKIK